MNALGPVLSQSFRITQEEKRKLYYVVNFAYTRNFAKIRQAMFLYTKIKKSETAQNR